MKNKIKKYGNTGMQLAKTGIGFGVLSSIDTTGTASNMSKALPAAGSIIGSGMVIDSIKYLNKKK